MKISTATDRDNTQGHVLAMVLVVVTICAIALMSYLQLVNAQNRVVARSQGWNATVPVMEAGVEEALAHLNANTNNLDCDGWVKVGTYYRMERSVGDSYYVVTITATNERLPVIESRGFCRMPHLVQHNTSPFFVAQALNYGTPREGFIGRGVRINARKNGSLTKAMLSKGQINIGGTVRVDSYNSCDPNLSTGGLYDPTKADDSGDIASNGKLVKEISAGGDVQIRGHISTGPGGTFGINGDNVSIGSEEWIESGRTGVEPGWFRDDMNATIADSPVPPPGGFALPGGGWVGTTYYDHILPTGTYMVSSLQLSSSQKILVTGEVTLKVNGDLQITGSAGIEIASSGSLALYCSGSTASIGGSGIVNQTQDPWRFTYYGAKTNTRVTLGGASEFYGVVYAPYAELTVAGGAVIYGGTVSKTVKATGGFTLHYDQCLSKGGQGRYIVTSWDELTPQEVAQVP